MCTSNTRLLSSLRCALRVIAIEFRAAEALIMLTGVGWSSDGASHNLHNRHCYQPTSRGAIGYLQPPGTASTIEDVKTSTAGDV